MNQNRKADAIWLNGNIRTMNPKQPWVQALAVSNGRVVALGEDKDILNLRGAQTKVHQLHRHEVIPGLVDSHVHAIWGGLRDLYECYVGYNTTLPQLLSAVEAHVAKMESGAWIVGGPWGPKHLLDLGETPRAVLDRIAPDNPLILADFTQHSLWANSLALQVADISRERGLELGADVVRDSAGEPTGLLHESATGRLMKARLSNTPERLAVAARYMRDKFHGWGVTAIKEPKALESTLQAYQAADLRDELNLHTFCHISLYPQLKGERVPTATLREWRDEYRSRHVHPDGIKLFLDGVAPSLTAAFLEPYHVEARPGYDPAKHDPYATLNLPVAAYMQDIAELDSEGFTVKTHAVGDAAVRVALDAIEQARQDNGHSGIQHEVAHVPFIHADDVPRFAELDAVAEISPKLWYPNAATAGQIAVLGVERTQRCHPIRSLLESGALVTYGSDWPAAAPDANPWVGLAGMLTRRNPLGEFPGAVGPDQAINLQQALEIMTVNGARTLGMADHIGCLREGMSADFAVLDRRLEDSSAEEIAQMRVLQTVFEGGVVFE